MDKIKLLLAEDELSLGMIIKESLETREFEVTLCNDGEATLKFFLEKEFELIILDVMMPKKDGFTLAKEIRKINKHIPILFLTAKSQVQDVVEGFKIGGNDYLKKPFSMEELIIRCLSLLNRIKVQNENKTFEIGNYIFNYTKQTLDLKGNFQTLTTREAELLYLLYCNKNDTVDKHIILKKLWKNDDFFSGRSMDVFITKLRKKLNQDESIQIINSRNEGYKLIC
jgi:DNA-binding response OmpR family regulator